MSKFYSCVFALLLIGCQGAVSFSDDESGTDSDMGTNNGTTGPDGKADGKKLPEDCATPRSYFDREVWPKVGDVACATCHTSSGAASATDFVLATSAQPEYLATNFAEFSKHLQSDEDGFFLEGKATNRIAHDGGIAVEPNGDAHDILRSFAARVNGTHICDPNDMKELDIPYYDGIVFTSDDALLRRVSLALAGRLPTESERAMVAADGLIGVESVLDVLMSELAFNERIIESFQDIFLTAGFDDVPIGVFGYTHFSPTRYWFYDLYQEPEVYAVVRKVNTAIKREPMELIAHLVMNEISFTEILTADYMMVSPYTARSWGMLDEYESNFNDLDNHLEFIPARMPALHFWEGSTDAVWPENQTGYYAHAGIQSTFNYLIRHRSTDTNRNRLRASLFFKFFLGVDIMELAPAVTDAAAAAAAFETPTMESPDCVVCHQVLDPIAGLFRDFNNNGEVRRNDWYEDMFPPGYDLNTPFPEGERYRALQWLGELGAKDARFAPTMVDHAYYVLTQQKALRAPTDTTDPLFSSKRKGFDAQRAMINSASEKFVNDEHNFKTAIKALVLSDFYRAASIDAPIEDLRRSAELDVLGLDKLLTPEQLERKISAIFGEPWGKMKRNIDYSTDEFYMLYGGLNYVGIAERVERPNGIMGAIMRVMSNEVACEYVQKDFSEQSGILFPDINLDETSEAAIRGAIKHLYYRILGENRSIDSPEIDRTYALFSGLKSDGVQNITNGVERSEMPSTCDTYLSDDPSYSLRAWQGIVVFLLRHPQFLLQ